MIKTKENLRALVYDRLKDAYPVAAAEIDFLYPPQPKMGDLALSLPLQLAKKLKANPRQIAQDIVTRLAGLPGIAKTEIAGAGYINLFLDRSSFFGARLAGLGTTTLRPEETKIIVEHTNINPNKAAHIGHLRNACLGDTLVRCLRTKGENGRGPELHRRHRRPGRGRRLRLHGARRQRPSPTSSGSTGSITTAGTCMPGRPPISNPIPKPQPAKPRS